MKKNPLDRLSGEVAARWIKEGNAKDVFIELNDARKFLGLTPDQMLGHLQAGTLRAHASLPEKAVYLTADEIIRFMAAYGWKPYSARN